MGLHGSRELAENDSERIDERRGVEPGETADDRGRAERPGRGGPEEPQRAPGRDPEMARDVDPEGEAGQEVASPDAALALGPREGRGDRNGEGVDDRALAHAVELPVVDLVGVAHRGTGRGEAGAVRPDPRLIAGARETLGLDEAPRPGPRASRHPHSEGIEEERAGRDRGGLRKVFVVGSRDVLGEPPDGIPIAHDGGQFIAGAVIRTPVRGGDTGRRPPERLRPRSRNELPSLLCIPSGFMLADHDTGRVDIDGGVRASRTMVAANAIPGNEPLPFLPG